MAVIKSLKKAAIPLLTAMSLTVCAVGMSANAQNPNYLSGTSFGALTGRISISGNTTVTFTTTTTYTADELVVSGDVVNYNTGSTVSSNSNRGYDTDEISCSISWSFHVGIMASAFGSHEAYDNSTGESWVVYTSEVGFEL